MILGFTSTLLLISGEQRAPAGCLSMNSEFQSGLAPSNSRLSDSKACCAIHSLRLQRSEAVLQLHAPRLELNNGDVQVGAFADEFASEDSTPFLNHVKREDGNPAFAHRFMHRRTRHTGIRYSTTRRDQPAGELLHQRVPPTRIRVVVPLGAKTRVPGSAGPITFWSPRKIETCFPSSAIR